MFDTALDKFMALGIVCVLLLLGVGAHKQATQVREFKRVCVESGSTPLYNGRNWECL